MQVVYLCTKSRKMKPIVKARLVLDKRTIKEDGTHPVKLAVYAPNLQKKKLYGIGYHYSEEMFFKVYKSKKIRKQYEAVNIGLNEIKNEANKIANDLEPFRFDLFEYRFFTFKGDRKNVFNFIDEKIKDLETEKKPHSTIRSYNDTKKSLKEFLSYKGRKTKELKFIEIDKTFLTSYETWMVDVENNSLSTVGVYLRNLRHIFNRAIDAKEINSDLYPFKSYTIPTGKTNSKNYLTPDQLQKLFTASTETPEQEKAKNFFFLSYILCAMNLKDVLQLKWSNIDGNKITFERAKTTDRKKGNTETTMVLSENAQLIFNRIIDLYGTNRNESDFVFDVFESGLSEKAIYHRKNDFAKKINKLLKPIAKAKGLPPVSLKWTRQTFATIAMQNGFSKEITGYLLGHVKKSNDVMNSYFGGYKESQLKEVSKVTTEFLKSSKVLKMAKIA